MHAYGLAKKLRMSKILIPMRPGVASAVGFFVTPFSYEFVYTYKVILEEANLSDIEGIFRGLERKTIRFLAKVDKPELITFSRSIDMHYVGQGYEVNITLPSNNLSQLKKEDISEIFNSTYKRIYGRTSPDSVELMNLRIIATAPDRPFSFKKLSYSKNRGSLRSAIKGQREAYSPLSESFVDFSIYNRYHLIPGDTFSGPAIIEEKESTTIMDQDATASVDEYGTILITIRRK